MLTLEEITLNKYKCYDNPQTFKVDKNVTVLVGMNESGKTALLESIAKTNYFVKDPNFLFNPTFDYPRKDKKSYDKSGKIDNAVECKYSISNDFLEKINNELGNDIFHGKELTFITKYDNSKEYLGFEIDTKKFIDLKLKENSKVKKGIENKLMEIKSLEEFEEILSSEESEDTKNFLNDMRKYFTEDEEWFPNLNNYIIKNWIEPNLPKLLYYSEYYSLPSRINISELVDEFEEEAEADNEDEVFEEEDEKAKALKTSKALFELADINIKELLKSNSFESYIAELEATANEITKQLFKYWTTNQNLKIRFEIDRQIFQGELSPILDIRVENLKHMISLPLKNRSKGFNWFFSFIVWFSKIQEDKKSNYILLLDEPGLNLHASAQADLLKFIESLSNDYQIMYTTHSPFMVDSDYLKRIRTIVETEQGAKISDSIQEKDPNTLFPLQAALGYNIAQNLFISKNNLLVEGPTDLLYLNVLSNILEESNKVGLNEKITIVPVGGLDKVSTFIALLAGNKLNIACLLDSFDGAKGKQKVDDLIKSKIIKENKIRFFHEFVNIEGKKADIEDMFEKEEYISLFNNSFDQYENINVEELDKKIEKIVSQINNKLNIERYNHYRPANKLAQMAVDKEFFNESTLNRFESMFKEINKLFKI